ncbi:dipeptidylaminopeptidase/acylaminoacyl-peptidase -like protein [Planomonospora sphaerica]|uniref:Dipeptidylaminopeptidase/acylaminoacyl-peptidase-like protein n=1 Tax=Planomonospora sphaerica TaxID=161355 RepID=A0A161LTP5_9ACTN|nr:prolyl oligopeptidase family serine peptidase [Planomonospora sphaerica]GAT64791.1 dipeptidylaminopeptidase/acylaminoacyl-peptidase -like protein [Planomonospora sphaerica]
MTEILGVRARPPADTILTVPHCRTPALAPDGSAVAFVSDAGGSPRVWIRPLRPETASPPPPGAPADRPGPDARPVDTGPEPVADVSWSPTGGRLAVLVVPGGGEHTQVWTVRPDGGDLRPLAAPEGGSASFVRWTGRGEILLVTEISAAGRADAVLVDAATGEREVVASGPLTHPAAISRDHARLLLRRGPRGVRRMHVVDLSAGPAAGPPPSSGSGLPSGSAGPRPAAGERPLLAGLPGSTDHGVLSPDGRTAYLLTDVGRDRAALVAMPATGEGGPVVLAERPDAEPDRFALSADGRRAVLLWNAAGRSELEVIEPDTGAVLPLPPPPAEVVTSIRVSLDGGSAVLAAEGPGHPSHVLLCDLATGAYRQVAGSGPLTGAAGAEPVRLTARDGLELTGWLYRVPGAAGPSPFVVYLHGGPESQERPTFKPLFQNLVAAGIGVFAPNVRGSAGFGRAFRDADNHALRFRAIDDVADCAAELVRLGAADPSRIACMGRSYGGYLTLAALVTHPGVFRAGVDVCGMADFATFYARTEPWIAAAAVSEYGHPVADRDLLRALSPLHSFDRLAAPLLVVHGTRDTNVPLQEAEQVVEAARARRVPCDLLLFEDEGHEIRRPANRVAFVRTVVDWLTRRLGVPAPA